MRAVPLLTNDEIDLRYADAKEWFGDDAEIASIFAQAKRANEFRPDWANYKQGRDDAIADSVDALVNRFLGWRLPKDFSPDHFIKFDHEAAQRLHDSTNGTAWPVGTNLFTADQARELFKFLLAAAPDAPPALPDRPNVDCPCSFSHPPHDSCDGRPYDERSREYIDAHRGK